MTKINQLLKNYISPENTGSLVETHFYLSIKAGKLLYNSINSILGLGTQANRSSSVSHQVMYTPTLSGKVRALIGSSFFQETSLLMGGDIFAY